MIDNLHLLKYCHMSTCAVSARYSGESFSTVLTRYKSQLKCIDVFSPCHQDKYKQFLF